MIGGLGLSNLKKVMISLPNNLLEEIDSIVSIEKTNRSEFVRQAMSFYIRHKLALENDMKKGYSEMAKVNLEIANMCLQADNEICAQYENWLAESE